MSASTTGHVIITVALVFGATFATEVSGVDHDSTLGQPAPESRRLTPEQQEAYDAYLEHHRLRQVVSEHLTAQNARIDDELMHHRDQPQVPPEHWAHEWAGVYSSGSGPVIHLTPNAGFSIAVWNCTGLSCGALGPVTGTFDSDDDGRPDGVTVSHSICTCVGPEHDDTRLYFMRWPGPAGTPGRRYLVSESDIMWVVNSFNRGGYSRDHPTCAAQRIPPDDELQWRHPWVINTPELPEPWRSMFLEHPVDATIIAVGATTTRQDCDTVRLTTTRVTLDIGSRDGLAPGMEADVPDQPRKTTAKIISVSDTSSAAEIHSHFRTGTIFHPVAAGLTVRMAKGYHRVHSIASPDAMEPPQSASQALPSSH